MRRSLDIRPSEVNLVVETALPEVTKDEESTDSNENISVCPHSPHGLLTPASPYPSTTDGNRAKPIVPTLSNSTAKSSRRRRFSVPYEEPSSRKQSALATLLMGSAPHFSIGPTLSNQSVASQGSAGSVDSATSKGSDGAATTIEMESTCSRQNSYEVAHLTDQLEHFREARFETQARFHIQIFWCGAGLIVAGGIFEGIVALMSLTQITKPRWISATLHVVGTFMFSVGVLVISLNPLGGFDLNVAFARHPTARVFIGLFAIFRSVVLGLAPPYFSAVGVLPAVYLIVNAARQRIKEETKARSSLFRVRSQNRNNIRRKSCWWWTCFARNVYFTNLLVAIIVVWLIGNALLYVYAGIMGLHQLYWSWLIFAGCHILLIGIWRALWHIKKMRIVGCSDGLEVSALTESLYEATYGYLCIMGVCSCWVGVHCFLFGDKNLIHEGIVSVLVGLAYLAPLSALIFDREQMFSLVMPLTRLRVKGRERDGAFLAAMLDSVIIEVGRPWWIHRKNGQEELRYPKADHRHYWMQGHISRIEGGKFYVKIQGQPVEEVRDVQSRQATSKELLELARVNMRCLDWKDLTLSVLKGDLTNASNGGLTSTDLGGTVKARALQPGEVIDFFVSHSWYDDADLKYIQLINIAKDFINREGREPTFWLDHVCIDQDNILDGLKVLPVNVLGCYRFIALCGDTYLKRLWCAWELCTLMAFLDKPEDVLDTVLLVPVSGGSVRNMLEEFVSFDILQARCYDPNEQRRVRAVVHTIGVGHFNHMIQELGRANMLRLADSASNTNSSRPVWLESAEMGDDKREELIIL